MKHPYLTATMILLAAALTCGCGASQGNPSDSGFFTSGSREADQRAEQRMTQTQQLRTDDSNAKAQVKKPLYDRLGGDQGLQAIVNDFVDRAMADPRVNWERKDVKGGGVLGIGQRSVERNQDPAAVMQVKQRIVQFLSVATGGPPQYEGREMKAAHQGMRISNVEFDASIGDMKATLDKLAVGEAEQKELLAILESTRAQIVEQR